MNWQQYERDLPFITGAAMAINDINAQNQANANYNAVMQGYMSQGYTAEQAKMLTDEYFRPQWIRNEVEKQRRRAGWCIAFGLLFLLFFIAPMTQGGGFIGAPQGGLAGILFAFSAHFINKAEAIEKKLGHAQPTAHAGPQAAYSTVACNTCGWQHTYVDQQHAEAAAEKHSVMAHGTRSIAAGGSGSA